jgi:hypothetical protein
MRTQQIGYLIRFPNAKTLTFPVSNETGYFSGRFIAINGDFILYKILVQPSEYEEDDDYLYIQKTDKGTNILVFRYDNQAIIDELATKNIPNCIMGQKKGWIVCDVPSIEKMSTESLKDVLFNIKNIDKIEGVKETFDILVCLTILLIGWTFGKLFHFF